MVERYHYSEGAEEMLERDDGEFVRYSDYAKLEEALREAESNVDFMLDIASRTPERFARSDVESIAKSLARIREVLGNE